MHMYTLYSSYASLEYDIQNDRGSQNRFALRLIAFKHPVMNLWLRSSFLSLFPAICRLIFFLVSYRKTVKYFCILFSFMEELQQLLLLHVRIIATEIFKEL